MRPTPTTSLLLSVLACVLAMPAAQAGDEVTIYRCTDAKGQLALRDSPCLKGERQETRSMLRPKDAPPRPQQPDPLAPIISAAPPPPQVIVVHPPRPMYECISPDNTRYLSDTPEGRARWVPIWPNGYPITPYVNEPGRLNIRVDNGRLSGGYDSGGTRVLVPTYTEFGGGTWLRDPCHALPQVEVCARLRDQRSDLRRRFTIAQPSERAVLGSEERSINARLDQDCR